MYARRLLVSVLLVLATLLAACVAPVAGPAPAAAPAAPAAPTDYVNPDVLVDTEWVLAHLDDPNVRFLDLANTPEDYAASHIPGALFVSGFGDLTNPEDSTRGQILTQEAFSALFSRLGITRDTIVVTYDNSNNLWASRAYWTFKYYQHPDVRVYNGGLKKWIADGQALSTDEVVVTPTEYVAADPDPSIRTTTEYVLERLDDDGVVLCDARNPNEYAGTDVRSARGGHIPGAINVEWNNAVQQDGTFKDATALWNLYTKAGFDPNKQIITYCQTGVRGAHTWFVLRELLGYPDVRNYDGSWEEYGNRTDTPIES